MLLPGSVRLCAYLLAVSKQAAAQRSDHVRDFVLVQKAEPRQRKCCALPHIRGRPQLQRRLSQLQNIHIFILF